MNLSFLKRKFSEEHFKKSYMVLEAAITEGRYRIGKVIH